MLFGPSSIFAVCQAASANSSEPPAASAPKAPAAHVTELPGEIFCEIDDRQTGGQWLVTRDTAHPGGPGRIVRVEGLKAGGQPGSSAAALALGKSAAGAVPALPVIHAGDALIVEEHTAVVDARLEAVALGAAARGAELKARLKIGGKVVRVVAVAAGRAELQSGSGAQQ